MCFRCTFILAVTVCMNSHPCPSQLYLCIRIYDCRHIPQEDAPSIPFANMIASTENIQACIEYFSAQDADEIIP